MSRTGLAVLAVVVLGAAAPILYPYASSQTNPNAAFLAACDEAIKKRLKAPTTYPRANDGQFPVISVEKTTTKKAVTARLGGSSDDASYQRVRKSFQDLYRATGGPFRHEAFIQYDAENSFGAPIRETAKCELYEAQKEPPKDVNADEVLIDGKTYTNWLIEGMGITN